MGGTHPVAKQYFPSEDRNDAKFCSELPRMMSGPLLPSVQWFPQLGAALVGN